MGKVFAKLALLVMILTPALAVTMSAATREAGLYVLAAAAAAGAIDLLSSLRSL